MSKKRQPTFFDRVGGHAQLITTHTRDYPAGRTIATHFHDRGQLVYASRGVMTIRTSAGTWVVPTHRAVWIPSSIPHSITMSGSVAMRTLYFGRSLARLLPQTCCVVSVNPLLRELVLFACTYKTLNRTNRRQLHVIEVITDELKVIDTVPLQLPNPSDPRAQRVAELLLANTGNLRTLDQICKSAGASRRTMERLFMNDVGITLGRWRQQLCLLHAMRLLAEGAKVTHAALEAGYSTPSAFISMFKKTLGTTPAAYFRPAR